MRAIPRLVIAFCLSLSGGLPARAAKFPPEWQVDIEREVRAWRGADAPPVDEAVTPTPFTLRVGRGFFYLQESTETRLYDFAAERFRRSDEVALREDTPLAALVAGRERFLRRETDLLMALVRSGVPPAQVDSAFFHLEARAGMRSGLAGFPGRRASSASDEVVWTVGGDFASAWSPGGPEIPEDRRGLLRLFFIYETALHPEFRETLAAQAALPRQLRYREKIGTVWRETTLRFLAAASGVESRIPQLPEPRPVPFTPDALDRAAAEALGRIDQGRRPTTAAEYGRQFKELADRDFPVEALLSLIELYLHLGADTQSAMARLEAETAANPDLAKLLAGMDVSTAAAAAESLKSLGGINRARLLRKHVYDALVANTLLALGRYREAEPLYLAALEQNPWLVGVYKKLGDLYTMSDRDPQAWACYEIAARVNSQHPMLKPVIAEAPALKARQPDFFLIKPRR